MYIDISSPIKQNLISWPSGYETKIFEDSDVLRGDLYNNTILKTSLQTATHVNSPSFYTMKGAKIDEIDVNDLCGKCMLIRNYLKFDLNNISEKTKVLIIDTNTYINSSLGISTEIEIDFINQAKLKGVKAVGFDCLISHFVGNMEDNDILPIINGLVVDRIKEGHFNIIVLPLLIKNVKSSPARAVIEI